MSFLDDISTVCSLLHALVLVALLLEPRYSKKRLLFTLICASVPLLLLNTAIATLGGLSLLRRVFSLSCTLPSLLLFLLLSRHRGGRFFFTFFFCASISYAIIIFTAIIDALLPIPDGIFLLISRLLIFPVMELIIFKRLRPGHLSLQRSIPKGWTVFAIASAVYYLLFRLIAGYPRSIADRPEDIPVALLCCVLMPLTYLTCFRLLREQQKNFIAIEAGRGSLQQARILQSELDTEKAFVLSARRYRHDLRHHTALLQEYLRIGDIDGARAYLAEYDRAISESTLQDFCENKTANAIIRMTSRHCQLHGIDFSCTADIPALLPLSDIETGALFGNLLENAREACDAAPFAEKKLHITAEVRNALLCIELENSVDGTVTFSEDIPISTKTDGGIGVLSMKTILSEHGGMLSYSQSGNAFFSRIILPLTPDP